MNDLWQKNFVPDIREPRAKNRAIDLESSSKLEESLFGDCVLQDFNAGKSNVNFEGFNEIHDGFTIDTGVLDGSAMTVKSKRVFDVSSEEQKLRDEYEKLHGFGTEWATKGPRKRKRADNDENPGLDSILRSVSQVTQAKTHHFINDGSKVVETTDMNHIRISPFIDLNQSCKNSTSLCSVKFRKADDDNIFLTACTKERTLNLFRLTGVGTNRNDDAHEETSVHLHTLLLNDLPVTHADFIGRDNVVMVGHRPFVMKYDLRSETCSRKFGLSQPKLIDPHDISTISTCCVNDDWVAISGKRTRGKIYLLSSKNLELAHEIQLNCNASCINFISGRSNHELIASGADADVYIWDVRMIGASGACVSRFVNEDGTASTAVSGISNDSVNMIAVGSQSGVVSLYDYQDVCTSSSSAFKPTKAVMNLQTPISAINFSCCAGQNIMGFSSFEKPGAMRLMHLPSKQIISHWPNQEARLKRVSCMDFFSLDSMVLMAIGNNRGSSLCYHVSL